MAAQVVLGIGDSICSGACVVIDGEVRSAVSEERLNRRKMATGWPRLAIAEALRIAGVGPNEVEQVAVATRTLYWRPDAQSVSGYFDADWGTRKNLVLRLGSLGSQVFGSNRVAQRGYYGLKAFFSRQRVSEIDKELRTAGIQAPIDYVEHHLAHAASAYYSGGVEDCAVVTLDGAGDGLSATVYRGHAGRLERVAAIPAYDSIGNFYSYVTHILGFKAHRHEGKITGLAAYGKPVHADLIRSLVGYRDGRIINRSRSFHTAAIEKLRRLLPKDPDPGDLAASIQLVLEEVATSFVAYWVKKLGTPHLALAGGVPANVKLNQRLLAIDDVKSCFVYPAMGDDGLACGAALFTSVMAAPHAERVSFVKPIAHMYLGPSYGREEMRRLLEESSLEIREPTDLAAQVARLIASKKVVARFDGAMEFGPRALGNRSILVHAGDPSINDWLNKRLDRTEFMPFAPASLANDRGRLYRGLEGAEHSARFMTITCDCTEELTNRCPAVVHVDGTARPQLVDRQSNRRFAEILEEYRKIEGHSTVINTSFNMHEEPIVCTPQDAIRAFKLGNLDYLALGDFLAARPGSSFD